jgi:hypothetical protein
MLARAVAVPLIAFTLFARMCGSDERVAALEEQKQELLAATVEKKEFWAEVERKGVAAKKRRELDDERIALEQALADAEARRTAVEPSIAPAREVNARAEAVKEEIARREAELAGKIGELETTLAAWKAAGEGK